MTITSPPVPSKSGGRRANALPIGCMLDEYRIDSILGAGGFGVTYQALDTHLDTWVAIKEYFPVEWSFRDSDGVTVYPNTQGEVSGSDQELSDYYWGLERFLDEARVLARIQHPYVVRVKRYFRAHGTAYIVMDYEEGQPLSTVLQDGEKLNEAEVRGLLEDVLPALRAVHDQGYLHRDIKPSNLYLRASDHRVILIDFGAARQAVGRHSQSVTSLVTPGYSPPEQYTTRNDRYGAWTDIYALGAVLYRCITGRIPTEAAERLLDDTLEPAVKAGAGRYSTNLLRAIDRMLAVRPDQRFSTVVEAQAALMGASDDSDETVIMLPITPVKPAPMFETSRVADRLAAGPVKSPEASPVADRSAKPLPESAQPDHSDWLKFTQPSATAHATSVEPRQNSLRKPTSRWRLIAFVGGGVALAAVAAALIWLGLSEPTAPSTSQAKQPPRYRLGQQEPAVANPPPTATESPVSTAPPSPLSPTTSDAVADSPAPTSNDETTPSSTPFEELAVGDQPESAVVESSSETVSAPDLSIVEDGSQPTVTEEASEMTDSSEPLVAPDEAESTVVEDRPETTSTEESTASVSGAPVVPGTVPAKIKPKVDTSSGSAQKRAAEQGSKAPRKTRRTQQAVKKNTRPWKVIPYDSSARKPSRRNSTGTAPRGYRGDTPGNSGFNQK